MQWLDDEPARFSALNRGKYALRELGLYFEGGRVRERDTDPTKKRKSRWGKGRKKGKTKMPKRHREYMSRTLKKDSIPPCSKQLQTTRGRREKIPTRAPERLSTLEQKQGIKSSPEQENKCETSQCQTNIILKTRKNPKASKVDASFL